MTQYFGTDGIRGRVGDARINPEFMLKLGWAVGKVLATTEHARVVIGKDTRLSGYMLESALEAGLSAAGVDVLLLGPMPTPAVAYLTRTFRAQVGVAISASHNPFYDNGVKFFDADGFKLSKEIELAIEAQMQEPLQLVEPALLGKAERVKDAPGRYIEFCKSTFPNQYTLNDYKIVVDCANGAAYHVADKVLHELGAEVVAIGCKPDGMNINEACGATDTRALQQAVLQHKADLGVALDGDADRLILVDHNGVEVDGDEILGILATELAQHEKPAGVVGTLMTNLGLQQALEKMGVPFMRADVGDRYVMEMLQQQGWKIGGEASGHLVNLDLTTTGDGLISALQVLRCMCAHQQSLAELKTVMTKCPLRLINVKAENPKEVVKAAEIQQAAAAAEKDLEGKGRVLLRASGTEPKVRVMVEANTEELADKVASELVKVVEDCIKEKGNV